MKTFAFILTVTLGTFMTVAVAVALLSGLLMGFVLRPALGEHAAI